MTITTETHAATGLRLREMRLSNKMTVKQAAEAANKSATLLSSDTSFTQREIRRYESIERTAAYGKTYASLEKLRVLLHAYNGNPGYLLMGIEPVTYPTDMLQHINRVYFNADMVLLMSTVGSWSEQRRSKFIEHFREFYC